VTREIEVDVCIVGAGPAGLYATYYAGFRGLTAALVDALPQPGGQMSSMYPEKLVFDVAGHPAVKAQTLVDALVDQAWQADPTLVLGETATDLDATDTGVVVRTDAGTTIRAGGAIVAAGMGRFTPRPLPAGAAYDGRGLRYFVPRLAELAGHEVLVVGGGDSAVDWALSLEPLAAGVTLVHRRDAFRAHEHSLKLLESSTVKVLTPYEISDVLGEHGVETAVVAHVDDGRCVELGVTSIVAALGFKADLGPIASWDLHRDGRDILVDRSMRTNLPRVFAVGDVAGHADKVKLISVGFGEAATAVNHLAATIRSGEPVMPGHSSDAVPS
jgi:thioredoxin reductase (NADPH)